MIPYMAEGFEGRCREGQPALCMAAAEVEAVATAMGLSAAEVFPRVFLKLQNWVPTSPPPCQARGLSESESAKTRSVRSQVQRLQHYDALRIVPFNFATVGALEAVACHGPCRRGVRISRTAVCRTVQLQPRACSNIHRGCGTIRPRLEKLLGLTHLLPQHVMAAYHESRQLIMAARDTRELHSDQAVQKICHVQAQKLLFHHSPFRLMQTLSGS